MRSGGGVVQYSVNGPTPSPSLTLSTSIPNLVTATATSRTRSRSRSSSVKSAATGTNYVGGGVVGKRRLSSKLMVSSTHSTTLLTPILSNNNNNNNIRMMMMMMMMSGSVGTTTTTSTSSSSMAELEAQPKNRRLILLRHAQSSWDNPSLRDHERPLSKSGEADAANLSLKLQLLGWIPQLILSSDAVRSRETLRIMQKHASAFSDAQVIFIPSFYSVAAMDGQTALHLQHTICTYSRDDILTVMCMGHNRGWEEAASMFAGASVELKTCNAALLQSTGNSWPEAFASAGLGGWKLLGVVKPNGI